MKKAFQITIFVLLALALSGLIYIRLGEQPAELPQTLELTPLESPSPSPVPTPSPSPEPFADKPQIDTTQWNYTLANGSNPLSAEFAPELTAMENGQNFDSRAADALKEFLAGARQNGLSVYLSSTYRSYKTQEYLFNNKVNQLVWSEGGQENAIAKAKTIVAYPGTSEHQLGLAADITDRYYETKNESLADTELSKWMAENCADYGFILRYPQDKIDITGVMFEPWHFRYVGQEAAKYIMENKLCLEEFLALYKV